MTDELDGLDAISAKREETFIDSYRREAQDPAEEPGNQFFPFGARLSPAARLDVWRGERARIQFSVLGQRQALQADELLGDLRNDLRNVDVPHVDDDALALAVEPCALVGAVIGGEISSRHLRMLDPRKRLLVHVRE